MIKFVNRILASFLRLFFYLLYNPFSWSYDWVATIVSLNQWSDWIRCVLPFLTGERILELGHGPGHLQISLHQAGFQVYGLDLSRRMGLQARRRLRRLSFSADLVHGKAQQLPFAGHAFDQVVSTFPSDYLFQSQTLTEIYRVLIPGGLLVVLPVAWIHRGSWIERVLANLFQITHQSPVREDDKWQIQLLDVFQQAGFDVSTTIVPLTSSEVFLVLASKVNVL